MKSNELMLGDIILKDGQPGRVIELYGGEVADCYAPVFITPEILEANGIRHYKDCGRLSYYKRMDIDFVIRYEIYAGYIGIELCDGNRISVERITKVHELQHVLRLIGMNDLADNFIIEKGGEQ